MGPRKTETRAGKRPRSEDWCRPGPRNNGVGIAGQTFVPRERSGVGRVYPDKRVLVSWGYAS